jgi:hypothetical protein
MRDIMTDLAIGLFNPPHWEHWNEDKTPARTFLCLKASSYMAAPLFNNPPKASPRSAPKYLVSPNGNFAYQNAILPGGTPLDLRGGYVMWNDDIVLPMLLDMNMRQRDGEQFPKGASRKERVMDGVVWMSLTPMEMLTQRSGVKKARGKVLIGKEPGTLGLVRLRPVQEVSQGHGSNLRRRVRPDRTPRRLPVPLGHLAYLRGGFTG